MKLSFTFFLGTLAMTKAKSLRGGNKKLMPNGMSCNYCPDDDDYVWPPDYSWHPPPIDRKLKTDDIDHNVSVLEAAAEAAAYEASFLESLANHRDLADDSLWY